MNIENKTNEEIKAHIVKMCDSYNKTGKDLYLKIKAECEAELERRAQKKSDPQPIEKIEKLEETEKIKRAALNPSLGIPALNETPEKLAADQKKEFGSTMQKAGLMGTDQPSERFNASLERLSIPPTVAPKPTATIHFAGQQYPGQYTRGELWSDVRQNFKLVLLSATFRRCLNSGNYSELWSMVLYVKLWQGIHEGLKKLEGGKDYTMEELLIRHWAYGEDLKEAGRVLAEFLKQPKPE